MTFDPVNLNMLILPTNMLVSILWSELMVCTL